MKIIPLYHNILVDPMADGDVTQTGLLIPAVAKRSSMFRYGVIVATGAGRINAEGKVVPLAVKDGDVIMFVRNAGTEVTIETDSGVKLMLMLEERFILGIVEGLPQKTTIMGLDGRLMAMEPMSRTVTEARGGAAPDCVYENIEGLERAERAGWVDPSEHVDEETHD